MASPRFSLDFRIGLLRRRRRLSLAKQLLAVVAPGLLGVALLLLLAGAAGHV